MQKTTSAESEKNLGNVIKIDEAQIQNHLGEMVRSTVEETLNAMLDAEADQLCKACRYEHTEARADQRAGHYNRKLHTKAGEVELKIPKLRCARFETAIIERYKRIESSVEEALMEMYLAGVLVRRVEDITQALWGMRVSAGTVSDLNQKIYERIEHWHNRKIEGIFPYVYLDGISLIKPRTSLRAYPSNRLVMRPSEKFEAKAAGQNRRRRSQSYVKDDFDSTTQASDFAAGRNRVGYSDRL